MTLSKQLLLSGMLILLCLFLGMITFVIKDTQDFLDQQLSSHSQDTATALGLCLTFTMKSTDVVTASRVVDAIWDRGYYQSVIIEGANGAPIVQREMDVVVHDVPNWFIEMINLHIEPKEALILDGWHRIGKVIIKSNPGFAYRQIWTTFINSIQWFVVTAIIAIIIGSILLYFILRPLRDITAQAAAICNQQFLINPRLPWTLDLRKVVEAMNNMSRRLKTIFEEQSKTSAQLREQVYRDPITQLSNRLYFDLQLTHFLNGNEDKSAILLLIELEKFAEYNSIFGFPKGDQLLKNTAQVLESTVQDIPDALVSHAKGASFFMLLPEKLKTDGDKVAQQIINIFNSMMAKELSNRLEIGNVGVVMFKQGADKTQVISQADMALRAAQAKGSNQWHFISEMQSFEIHSATDWKTILSAIITTKKIIPHFQETRLWNQTSSDKWYETLMRIQLPTGEVIPAGVFMPMAEQFNLMLALDKILIEKVVTGILRNKLQGVFSFNLSVKVLDDKEFKGFLFDKLKQLGKKANQLMIELPEQAVIQNTEKVRAFFQAFSKAGGRTAIDHYGRNFNNFSYLYNLKLNILKIDGSFIRNIQENQQNQFFVRSLVDIAHSLDILVIAEAVETQAEHKMLEALKVDGVQGYLIGKPTSIEME